jgi:hypothetical protein
MISFNKSISENYRKKYSRYHLSLPRYKDRTQNMNSSSIGANISLVPVRSSYCQTEIEKNDSQIIDVNLNQSEKNISLYQPLMFMNREISFKHNRTSVFRSDIDLRFKFSSLKQSALNEVPPILHSGILIQSVIIYLPSYFSYPNNK